MHRSISSGTSLCVLVRKMAKKMDMTVMIVSAMVGSLGLLSAILGFAAETAKTHVTGYYYYGYYLYTASSSKPGLRIGAAVLLLASQIIVSAVGSCKFRAIPSGTKRIVGIVCAVFSWILAVIAFVLFLQGRGSGVCAGASVLTLIATALGITSFIMMRRQPAADATPTVAPVVAEPDVTIKERKLPQPPAVVVIDPRLSTTKIPAAHSNSGHDERHSQPAAGGTQNRPDEQPPHTVVAVDHQTKTQPAAIGDRPSQPGEQPRHTVVTTTEQQLPQVPRSPQPQVSCFMQPQQQLPNHVQTLAQDEQRPLLTTATTDQSHFVQQLPHQVVYYVVQQPQPTPGPVQPQLPAGHPALVTSATVGAHQPSSQPFVVPPAGTEQHLLTIPTMNAQPSPQVYAVQQPSIDPSQLAVEPQMLPVQLSLPAAAPVQQGNGQEKLSTVIRNELGRTGVKLFGRVVQETLFPDSGGGATSATDMVLSMISGSDGGDAGATECEDPAAN